MCLDTGEERIEFRSERGEKGGLRFEEGGFREELEMLGSMLVGYLVHYKMFVSQKPCAEKAHEADEGWTR